MATSKFGKLGKFSKQGIPQPKGPQPKGPSK